MVTLWRRRPHLDPLAVVVGVGVVLAVIYAAVTLHAQSQQGQAAAAIGAQNNQLLEQVKGLGQQDQLILRQLETAAGDLVTQTGQAAALQQQIAGVVNAIQAASDAQGQMLGRLQAQEQCAVTAASQAAAGRCLTGALAPAAESSPGTPTHASPSTPAAPAPAATSHAVPAPVPAPKPTCHGQGKKAC